ncbi:MAG: flagellar motor protein MotB [Elusimicrobiota bacterium]
MAISASGRLAKARASEDIQIGKSSPPWMVTYSDLVTQLLIFFVMMFALASTLNEMQLQNIKKRLEDYTYKHKLEDVIYLEINTKGLLISLNAKLMFDSGKAEIYEDAKNILADISTEIIDVPNNVRIEGHTDSWPIETEQFPSNWELSTMRATNIARHLIERLDFPPDRLSAGGFSKYHPAVLTDFDKEIDEYKDMVEKVPGKYSRELSRAKTDEETEAIHRVIRDEQLRIQMDLKKIIQSQIDSANKTNEMRSLNRRVDIIVQRLGSGVGDQPRRDVLAAVSE